MSNATMTVEAVRNLRLAGKSYAEIGQEFGVNKGSAHKFAKKHGLLSVQADPQAAAALGDYSGLSDAELQINDEAAEVAAVKALKKAWTDHGYDRPERASVRKGGNYVFDQETTNKVVAAIYGPPGSRDWVLYNRTEFALRANVGVVERAGIAVKDERGWTRPWLHILVDLQHIALNSPVRDALRFLEEVYGSDANEMLKRFTNAGIHIANQAERMSELDFINQTLGGRHAVARHPDTKPKAQGAAA